MDEKKKGIIFGIIGLIAGIAMISYGVINLMSNREETPNQPNENETNNGNTDGPSISTNTDEVRTWLDDNQTLINYFINNNFDLDTATPANISDVFGWYFVNTYDHGEGNTATDSKYSKRYTMPKSDAETFMLNYLGVPVDMLDLTTITLSKDNYNFTSDDENYYVEVSENALTENPNSDLSDINILSDSEINVIYGIMEDGETCEGKDDCYIKTKTLTLRKADSGFTILRAQDN